MKNHHYSNKELLTSKIFVSSPTFSPSPPLHTHKHDIFILNFTLPAVPPKENFSNSKHSTTTHTQTQHVTHINRLCPKSRPTKKQVILCPSITHDNVPPLIIQKEERCLGNEQYIPGPLFIASKHARILILLYSYVML